MLYFASDIHGEYDLFIKLLDKIHFSNQDKMIICGDIVDKGPDSVRLARFIFSHSNIHCILGNHEYQFLKYYWSLMRKAEDDFDNVLKKLQDYFPNDGYLLDWEAVDNFEKLSPYIETDDFICVHAGIPLGINKNILPLREAEIEQLVYDRVFKEPNVLPQSNKCVFFGHTPARYISGEDKVLLYPRRTNLKTIKDYYKIHLDMGTTSSGVIGCICIDTWEEFYVRKNYRQL